MVIIHFSPPNMVFPLPPTFPPPFPHLKANNNSVRNRNTKCYNVSNTSQKAGHLEKDPSEDHSNKQYGVRAFIKLSSILV